MLPRSGAPGPFRVDGSPPCCPQGDLRARPTPSDPMDLTDIRKLVRLMQRADLSELEIDDSNKGLRVHLKRQLGEGAPAGAAAPVMQFMAPAGAPAAAPGMAPAAAPEAGGAEAALPPGTEPFPSPMVGTFYRSPSPDADSFVDVGDGVVADQVLCIIEAMKVMNEIRSEAKGKIVDILVENGEPVEFGQPLFLIQKG